MNMYEAMSSMTLVFVRTLPYPLCIRMPLAVLVAVVAGASASCYHEKCESARLEPWFSVVDLTDLHAKDCRGQDPK